MPQELYISPFSSIQENCTADIGELIEQTTGTCSDQVADAYEFPFPIESFAINPIAWFKTEW